MSYNLAEIKILLLLDNHLGPQTARDKQEARNLAAEIRALVANNPGYVRIVSAGVEGPGV